MQVANGRPGPTLEEVDTYVTDVETQNGGVRVVPGGHHIVETEARVLPKPVEVTTQTNHHALRYCPVSVVQSHNRRFAAIDHPAREAVMA